MSDDNWYDKDDMSEELNQDDDSDEQDTQDADDFHQRRGGAERVELEYKVHNFCSYCIDKILALTNTVWVDPTLVLRLDALKCLHRQANGSMTSASLN